MNDRLNLEILGLLLQVAWADGEISAAESDLILRRARAANLGDEHVARIEACLRGEATLPPPDLGFLRAHRDAAMAAVRKLIGSDDELADEEQSTLAERRLACCHRCWRTSRVSSCWAAGSVGSHASASRRCQ
jgi:hypothetical protein